jgi:hypothetical protein
MTPSDFTRALTRLNEHLQTVRTAAASMLVLAVLAIAGAYGVSAIQPRLADVIAGMAVAGTLLAVGAAYLLARRRDEVYDDILLSGYRHVGGSAVARRAAELVSIGRRRHLATTLERFADAAQDNRPVSVPLHRSAIREMRPRVMHVAGLLRADQPVGPAGMVLVRRLVTDGVDSPLFHSVDRPRDLEGALDRIEAELVPEQAMYDLRLAA